MKINGTFILVIMALQNMEAYLLMIKRTSKSTKSKNTAQEKGTTVKKGMVFGSDDLKTFRDSDEGILEKGGIDGEGSHRLKREGGESQTAYLTSSIVDLDQFVSHKVKVWGETNKARKAGWLMDVGRVEVLE